MKSNKITATKEEYIRMIYLLSKKSGDGVKSVDIAERLGLRKSTVSESLKDLSMQKFVIYEKYSNIYLTKKGENLGNWLTYRHRIIEVFLYQKLGIPKSLLHSEADRLEHGFSDKVIRKLANFLDLPAKDPHGKDISLNKNKNNS